ncbi:MAG: 6-phosphofructokinase, partial [Deltaproteobacteria bacterium]|nr:6-phosphofructokinase [Deltaproteobacteria bacterium]
MKLGILTGGGDCPGLNALIRAVVKRGTLEFGHTFVGIADGYRGLMEPDLASPLTREDIRGILPRGGTILGTSNKANPFQWAVKEDGRWVERDLSDVAVARVK